jgi:hypothetical protein
MTGLVFALAVVVGLLGVLVVGLLRSHAEILRKLDSLGAAVGDDPGHAHDNQLTRVETRSTGSTDIVGVTPDGESVAVSLATGEDPTLVAFLSTSCSSCTEFWENLDASTRYFGGHRHRVLLVTLGADEESPTRAQSLRRGQADVVMSSEAWQQFEVPGAPYFIVVDSASGVVGEGSAQTFPALEEFLSDSSNDAKWDERQVRDDEDDRIDRDLRAAGIDPGDQRLYPEPGELRGGSE